VSYPKGLTRADMESRRDRIASLTRQGLTAEQIAQMLDCTTRTVRRARKIRECQVYLPRPFTPEEVARAEALFDDGCSCAEVARTLGRDPTVVWHRWPHRAWTLKQASEMGVLARQARRVLRDR
jgi:IS30 family transposase